MTLIVAINWDPSDRSLTHVPVNDGNGAAEDVMTVPDDYAAEVSAACALGLPRVGELVVAGDNCLLELSPVTARWCKARWRGGAVRLSDATTGAVLAEMSGTELRLPDTDAAQRADSIGPFLLFDPPTPLVGCWVGDGGLPGWLQRREAKRAEAAARAAAKAQRARDDTRFINPYTFVPFPSAIVRAVPAGHHRLAPGRLSGRLRVRWRFTTPFQAPPGAVDGERLRLPGASVKGAVRSLHETLAGGCLRVLDSGFVPSYRDAAAKSKADWTLAVVAETTQDGQALSVRVADQVVWVRGGQLAAAWPGRLQTGSRVSFTPPTQANSLGRFELSADAAVTAGGDWVVLLSGARPPTTKHGVAPSYFAACGRITAAHPVMDVDEHAWRTFRIAVAGAREVVQARSATTPQSPWVKVEFPEGQSIGRRKRVTGRLADGDVLWVRRHADGRRVDALRLAEIWRHPGSGSLGERVPPHLHACTDPVTEGLCPSCRLFGSADTRVKDDDGKAQQRSYAGHVRLGDAVSDAAVALTAFRRAPMGVPRPGAGQFYLDYTDPSAAAEGQLPTREWGATPDAVTPRLVRGRKFYWHADPGRQRTPRHEARAHHRPQMVADRLRADAGTALVQTITFDNLDRAEFGGLLATLEPHRVLPTGAEEGLWLHLGGGKPFGLGSCTATVEDVQVWTAHSRYAAAAEEAPDIDTVVAEFVASCPPQVTATWPALAAVLGADTVDARRVWYPPGAAWSEQKDYPKVFDEPFVFFTTTSGMYLAHGQARPLLALPDPTAEDQSLPIQRKADKESRPAERLQ